MSSIEIRKIGITKLDTDAVVNAANTGLWEGGGVCGYIFHDAGSNRYGHPHKETLEIFSSLGVPVFVTSECGETNVRKKGRRYCIARRWEKIV